MALGDDLYEFTSGTTLFTGATYNELLKINNENFLVSPFSVQTVLALTQSGAEGETAEEIRTSLHLHKNKEKIESVFSKLLPTFKNNQHYSLNAANKIYVKENFPINEEFRKIAIEVYQADLENINFSEEAVAAKTMNDWVKKQTENKIHELISANDLTKRTRVILINALYFKANWLKPFELNNTMKIDFYKNAEDIIQVNTMHDFRGSYNYYESPELNSKLLEIPFEGDDASMTIVLPNEKEGLAALEKHTEQLFATHKFTREIVNVALPKFKIDSDIDFKEILKSLGIRKAFSEDDADLSGIAGQKGDLLIDKVKQKTFINVNEVGVEAAAATFLAVAIPKCAFFREPEPEPKNFIADHPFIFYMKVRELIIFGGRVLVPNQ